MWSVRMRASARDGAHVSGAEGLFDDDDVQKAIARFAKRALGHPKGKPDNISINVEKLRRKPKAIDALPVCTLECPSPSTAKALSVKLLRSLGILDKAIKTAIDVLYGRRAMRGAALVDVLSGRRLEPDRKRGVRASMMGIEKGTLAALGRRLSRLGINTPVVKHHRVSGLSKARLPADTEHKEEGKHNGRKGILCQGRSRRREDYTIHGKHPRNRNKTIRLQGSKVTR
jgi:6-carboxyhexanoate--CoA ligase